MRTSRFSFLISIITNLFVVIILGLNAVLTPTSEVIAAPMGVPLAGVTYDCTLDQSQIPDEECNALVAFYNSTNGDFWNENTNWLQTDTPCSWYGVDCNGENIEQIFMPENNLSGSIPWQIGNLSKLVALWLDGNNLIGSIPIEIGEITQLQYLVLGDNQLNGEIPNEIVSLSNLKSLDLSYNQLSGSIPFLIGNLSELISLNLSANNLYGNIPSSMGNLTKLEP